jgi:hypothetical protein
LWVGSWPYPQTLSKAGNLRQGQTPYVICSLSFGGKPTELFTDVITCLV